MFRLMSCSQCLTSPLRGPTVHASSQLKPYLDDSCAASALKSASSLDVGTLAALRLSSSASAGCAPAPPLRAAWPCAAAALPSSPGSALGLCEDPIAPGAGAPAAARELPVGAGAGPLEPCAGSGAAAPPARAGWVPAGETTAGARASAANAARAPRPAGAGSCSAPGPDAWPLRRERLAAGASRASPELAFLSLSKAALVLDTAARRGAARPPPALGLGFGELRSASAAACGGPGEGFCPE